MTAIARKRKRRTIFAAVSAVVLSAAAVAMVVVGVVTLSNSREGEAVGIDERQRVQFPATPNGLLAVTDDDGELASLVVLTLLPEGQGGSLVTVPVNADSTAGFGLQRRPVDDGFEADDIESVVAPVEEMLSITIQRAQIVDAEGLADLLGPIDRLELIVPQDVIDTSTGEDDPDGDPDSGAVIIEAGPQRLSQDDVIAALTATDEEADRYEMHDVDVAIWSALSRTAPTETPPEAIPVDDFGRPIAPSGMGELIERLWEGDVGVRDLALATLAASDNPTDADVVLLDRRDSTLVFAQISPGLVSTPTTGLKTRVLANYTDEQLAQSDGLFATTADLTRGFIGQMLSLQNGVVSVDAAPTGAPDLTVIEVADEQFLADTEAAAEALFGQAEVRLAETVTDGVDIEVTLGMSYIVREMVRAGMTGDEEATSSTAPAPTGTDTVGTDG